MNKIDLILCLLPKLDPNLEIYKLTSISACIKIFVQIIKTYSHILFTKVFYIQPLN